MTIDARQISMRFAALGPEARRKFLDKLKENGVDFAALPIAPTPRDGDLPLSEAQRGLWLTWQRDPSSPAYNLGGVISIDVALDEAALRRALRALAQRHEPLRTVFGLNDAGEPVQRVLDAAEPSLVARDLTDEAESDAAAEALARAPFDLETGPLLRLELHRIAGRSRLALALHHIVADGESVSLIVQELSAFYEAEAGGSAPVPPPLTLHFADYVHWRRDWLEAGEKQRQLAFWREALGDGHEPLELAFDRKRRAPRGTVEGGSHAVTLSPALSDRLRDAARAGGATLFMAVLTLFRLTLARWSGRDDVRIGAPLSNRTRAETHGLVGYFATTVTLGGALDQRVDFAAALASVREELLAASENVDVPFDAVIEALRPPRIEGVHPLFQVKCTEQQAGGLSSFGGFDAQARSLSAGEAHFDLSLDIADAPAGVECHFAYARDLFDAATIERFAQDFAALTEAATDKPTRPLADLALAPGAPAAGPVIPPETASEDVVDLWRRLAAAAPGMTALVDGGRSVTRAELDRASDSLARRLVACGVTPETRVALDADRSAEWVLGALAILKAGGAYVALDPAAPLVRRAALVADSGARLVVSAPGRGDELGLQRLTASFNDRDEGAAEFPAQHGSQAAYLVYTSGSTGEPKGVVVTRGGLASYVRGAIEVLSLPEGSRLAMVSTVAADLGNTMIYGALCGGGELHLANADDVLDPDRFSSWMSRNRIDALKITPSHLQALMQGGAAPDALPKRTLVLGGEATGWDLLDRIAALAPALRVVNHYGPTETTIGATRQYAGEANRRAATLPIGEAFGAAVVHVLDGYLTPAPDGAPGELYIGGGSLARGYAGRPGESASRFVPDPFGARGSRLYRTGDRVRRLSSGAIEFLGRVDDQVKIRGFRVEPGEVAAAIREIDGVADAFVMAVDDNGAKRLVAYVAGAPAPSVDDITTCLAQILPAHMTPGRIVRMEALPLTPNGKVDRRALPQLEAPKPAGEPPRGEAEEALAAIWCELLGVGSLGRDDGFIALGGDSILSLKMLGRIRKQGIGATGKKVSLADILNARSLWELAAKLSPAKPLGRPDVVHLRREGVGAPLFCVPGLIVNSTEFIPLAEALGDELPIQGFVSHVYTEARWRGYDVAALADEYAAHIVEASPNGRCALLGWSSGGDLAFETARRLAGRIKIDFLGLVDVFEQTPLASSRPLSQDDVRQAEDRLEAWLSRSSMADRWQALFARMTPGERQGALAALLDENGNLPVDGPSMGAREVDLWAQIEKEISAAAHVHTPLPAQTIHVWQAEHSLSKRERLRDWSLLAPVADVVRIAGATHLDIIRAPAFHRSLRSALSAVSR